MPNRCCYVQHDQPIDRELAPHMHRVGEEPQGFIFCKPWQFNHPEKGHILAIACHDVARDRHDQQHGVEQAVIEFRQHRLHAASARWTGRRTMTEAPGQAQTLD